MTETRNTCCKCTTDVSIDERHLGCLVEVLVVHVVDQVQSLHINRSQPVHHVHKARHELFVSKYIALYGTEFRTTLLTGLGINTTRNSIGQALGQVGTSTEELHLLTGLCGRHTAADAIIVTPYRAHYIVIFVLDRTCLHRNQRSIVLEALRQTRTVQYSQVRLWRRTHILQCVKETEVVLGNHRTAILANTTHLKCSPYRVTREELVIRRNTGELHHTELHHQMVDQLLRISLSKSSLLEIALEVDVEEGRDTTYRHSSTILGLHSTEVAEIEPLHSLTCILSRLADIKTIAGSHLLQALESLDLHRNFLTKTNHLVDHLMVTHVGKIVLLLLNQEVDTIKSHTTIVTYDTATAVCIRQTSKNMIVANELHLGSVSIEDTIIVSLAIFVEDLVQFL